MLECVGILLVRILEARRLIANLMQANSSPYVILTLGSTVYTSQRVIKKGRIVDFNELFEFSLKEEDIGQSLELSVMCRDQAGDEFLG